MRFNSDLVHALAALLHVNKEAPIRLSDIAEREPDLSRIFLEQVFGKLRKAGLVRSHRGPGGGYTLIKNLEQISLQDVIDVLPSESRKSRSLPSNIEAVEKNFSNRMQVYASSYTLADMRNGVIPASPATLSQMMENTIRS